LILEEKNIAKRRKQGSIMSKEACVIILDVGSGMSAPAGVQHGSKTFLDVAKECVSQLLHQRLLFPKKQDQVSVLLVNANDTDNVVNDEQGGYENIFELSDWTRVSTALLKKVGVRGMCVCVCVCVCVLDAQSVFMHLPGAQLPSRR
jgi:hypothetical protein